MRKALIVGAGLLAFPIALSSTIQPVEATERINSSEGKITEIIPYANGNAVLTGKLANSKSEEALFTTMHSMNKVDLSGNYQIKGLFGSKYAILKGNSMENLIDLSTGHTSTKDLKAITEECKEKVRNILIDKSEYAVSSTGDFKSFEKLPQTSFGGAWFIYQARLADNQSSTREGNYRYGLYDWESGTCIELGKHCGITTFSTKTADIIKLTEFDKSSKGVVAELKSVEFLAENSTDLYLKESINIIDTSGDKDKSTTKTYIARVSKSGTQDNGFIVPTETTHYEVCDSNFIDNENYNEVKGYLNKSNLYAVRNNQIQILRKNGSVVEVAELDLVRAHPDFKKPPTGFDTNSNYKYNVVSLAQTREINVSGSFDYTFDNDGNAWVVSAGKVSSNQRGWFNDEFLCDTALDNIVVYDKNNLGLFSKSSAYYALYTKDAGLNTQQLPASNALLNTTLADKSKYNPTNLKNTKFVNPLDGKEYYADDEGNAVVGNWVKITNGKKSDWYFTDYNGQLVKNQWVNPNGVYYHLDKSGKMQTGFIKDNGVSYYLDENGAMVTGWRQIKNKWYFFENSGAMKTGWFLDGSGKWYYFGTDGVMKKSTKVDGYQLGKDGALI